MKVESKKLVEIPVRRCHRRDVDVGAVLLGMNKARKTENRTHMSMPKNLEQKKDSQSCQNLCQDNTGFCVKLSNGCQKGYYGVKRRQKVGRL
jgi:hypothetical protein